ncbi:unnamed protein product [Hyaloperonospora brassicae]|uniref:RRM domain-containing protein n=1 Tax=Hyaloperonospora brassicae TaxID=162125 RepID=A0AAV0TQB0_HYABA|nr:unnamed protein product [Hyaloperonospora brassicae]
MRTSATTSARTLETYLQTAIETSEEVAPASQQQKASRRCEKEKDPQREPKLSALSSAMHAEPLVQSLTLQKPKRRRRKSRLSNSIRQRHGRGKVSFRVSGLLTADQVDDEDEVEELQTEMCEDFSRFGRLQSVDIVRAPNVQRPLSIGDVVVTFEEEQHAAAAFGSYDGNVFGGQIVTCSWEKQRTSDKKNTDSAFALSSGHLTSEEVHDVDEAVNVNDDVVATFSQLGTEETMQSSEAIANATAAFSDADEQVRNGGHSWTADCRLQHSECAGDGVEAPIVQPAESLELVELVSRLLKRLAALQERAHKQHPRHSRRSRRLVLGMHEVRRGLLCSKVRLLVMAADQDESDVLDEKRAELVSIAAKQGVPTLMPMNRRKLGRVLQKSVRVSCVGVYSIEGANDLFLQVVQRFAQ